MTRITVQLQAVLAVLLASPGEAHYGREIAKAAGLQSGTLYPLLARLEAMRWVSSDWEDPEAARIEGRRPRRYYRLTGEGERVAHRELSATVARFGAALRPGIARA
jgi:PadR family transcriptional regulator, regulatory protein PadR